MDNTCPKCKKKLSIFYLKPTCPHCGCDILNYDLENRLEEDSKKAEAEFEKWNAFVDKFKSKFKKK